jgi:hypothetical protein
VPAAVRRTTAATRGGHLPPQPAGCDGPSGPTRSGDSRPVRIRNGARAAVSTGLHSRRSCSPPSGRVLRALWTGPWRAPVSRRCTCTLCTRTSTSCWRTSPGSLATHRRQSRPRWRRDLLLESPAGIWSATHDARSPSSRRPTSPDLDILDATPASAAVVGLSLLSEGVILDGRRPRRTCVPPYRADPFVPGPCFQSLRRPTTEPREDDRSEHRATGSAMSQVPELGEGACRGPSLGTQGA